MHHLEVFFSKWALPESGCQAAALNQQQKKLPMTKTFIHVLDYSLSGRSGSQLCKLLLRPSRGQTRSYAERNENRPLTVEKHSAIWMSPILYCPLGKMCLRLRLSPRISRAVPAVMVNHNVRYSGDVFFPSWMDGIQINDSNLSELCAEGENIFIFFLLNNKNASPAISIATIRSPETYFTRNSYILCRRK